MVKVTASRDKRIPPGAKLATINNQQIKDILDFQFYNDTEKTRHVVFEYDTTKKKITYKRRQNIPIMLEAPTYRRCSNDCHFCFIRGLPRSLRKELYFRDDDYRLSFLFGNFLSLTNIDRSDIKRIGRLKLSPLYISVHTTDPRLRANLFKNQKAAMINEQLSALAYQGIKMHCQIVVIPGVTDGQNLIKTVKALGRLYPAVASVGIVPVGKTRYVEGIRLVSKKQSRTIISAIEAMHHSFRKRMAHGFVYLADEFYIRADCRLPGNEYYDDFPQYENGIGMVRTFLEDIKQIGRIRKSKGKFLILTGVSAYPYLDLLKERVSPYVNMAVIAVENDFFGKSVTVSGLMSAADINRTIARHARGYDRIVLPPNSVNEGGQFLDGETVHDKRAFVSPEKIKELFSCLQ
jgi:putative radical SAM enzyme (TIGR03279 family)